jgi:Glycosyl hydrolases family 43
MSRIVEQDAMVHIFDTSPLPGGPLYVNDHTLIQGPDRSWHLFGIFHREPMGDDTEIDFVHAVANEPDPARWSTGAFEIAPTPYTIALRADRAIGETHLWAPHVVSSEGRYWMVYQGGGPDGDRASMRLAESEDLYEWKRVGDIPLFEDFCVARDPMLTRRENAWVLYYTRCTSTSKRVSGVAYRLSRNLVDWSEPHMVLTLGDTPPMPNSGFTESPFVFEREGYWYLSISSYPLSWDATMVYRSPAPLAFPNVPFTRLRAHAAEWIASGEQLFVTHAGPGQRGVWMSAVRGLDEGVATPPEFSASDTP